MRAPLPSNLFHALIDTKKQNCVQQLRATHFMRCFNKDSASQRGRGEEMHETKFVELLLSGDSNPDVDLCPNLPNYHSSKAQMALH